MTTGLSGFSLIGDNDSASRVVIDCSGSPAVDSVASTAFAGEYGAGQRVYFQVCNGNSEVDKLGDLPMRILSSRMRRVFIVFKGRARITLAIT